MASLPPPRCAACALFFDENFCARLAPDELANLNAASRVVSLRRGEQIPAGTIELSPILAVERGELSLQQVLHDGRRSISAFFVCGDIIDLRQADENRFGSLVALSDVTFCNLSPQAFDMIMERNQNAREFVWSNLQNRVYRSLNHISDLANKKAPEKLASFILECRNRLPGRKSSGRVTIPFRRRDVAEYLGMQPETISRSFRDLETRGLIDVETTSVVRICNLPDLRMLANGARDDDTGIGLRVLRVSA